MKNFLLFSILTILFITCSVNSKKITEIFTNQNIDGKAIAIGIEKGVQWTHKQKIGFMKLNIIPQAAVWIEDTEGNFLDTLFVTRAFGQQKWKFIKYDPDTAVRTTSLPYWMNQRNKAGHKAPTKNNPLPDTVTAATPKGSFIINSRIKKDRDEFVLLAEFNKSFDANPAFHEGEKEFTEALVNGQPSVVYAVKINKNDNINEYKMKVIGRAGETGDDDSLYQDISQLTTALEMVADIKIDMP